MLLEHGPSHFVASNLSSQTEFESIFLLPFHIKGPAGCWTFGYLVRSIFTLWRDGNFILVFFADNVLAGMHLAWIVSVYLLKTRIIIFVFSPHSLQSDFILFTPKHSFSQHTVFSPTCTLLFSSAHFCVHAFIGSYLNLFFWIPHHCRGRRVSISLLLVRWTSSD